MRFGRNGFAYGVQQRLYYREIGVNVPYAMVSIDPFKEGLSPWDLAYACWLENQSQYYTLKLFWNQWIGQLDVDASSNMVYILGSSMTEAGPGFVWAYPGRLRGQVISLLTPPHARVGTTLTLTATGGWSGNPIIFSIAPASDPGACTVDAAGTASFAALGTCVIAANQRGDDSSLDAPQALATIQVVDKLPQTITFTAPASGVVGQMLPLTLVGGDSGNPVVAALHPSTDPEICAVNGDSVQLLSPGACLLVFAVDPGTTPGVCTVSGSVVTYAAVGTCIVVGTQAGDSHYLDAEPVRPLILVEPAGRSDRHRRPRAQPASAAESATDERVQLLSVALWLDAGRQVGPNVSGKPLCGVLGGLPDFYDTPPAFNRMPEVHDEARRSFEGVSKKSNRLFVPFPGLARNICGDRYRHRCVSFAGYRWLSATVLVVAAGEAAQTYSRDPGRPARSRRRSAPLVQPATFRARTFYPFGSQAVGTQRRRGGGGSARQ